MKEAIRRVPVPLAGVMLGFTAYGNFLKNFSDELWLFMEAVAGFVLVLLLLKVLTDPEGVREELRKPAIAGASGTFSMGLMFLAVSVKNVSRAIGIGIWWVGLLLHVVLIICFTTVFVRHFALKNVYMSWFLVYVGIVAAAATSPAFGMQRLGRILTVYGLIVTVVLMIGIGLRYRRLPVEKPFRPLGAICAAPFSLCLVGLNQSFPDRNPAVLLTVLCLANIFYVLGLVEVFRYIRGPFFPSFSGFTFPFINTAIGTSLTLHALHEIGFGGGTEVLLSVLSDVQCVIASFLLAVVFLRYGFFLIGRGSQGVLRKQENRTKNATEIDYDKEIEIRGGNQDVRAYSYTPESDRIR